MRIVENLTPKQALERLMEGNRRFVDSGQASATAWSAEHATAGQKPFAVVLGCSDSRAPVEKYFDQGFGDIFVVRVAGNIVAPSIIGSVEYAVAQFGTPLVLVMGHTGCGAVAATIEALRSGDSPESQNIRDITDRIAPHIEGIVHVEGSENVLGEAVRANVRASVELLRRNSGIIEERLNDGRVAVLGAECELETGRVHLLDSL